MLKWIPRNKSNIDHDVECWPQNVEIKTITTLRLSVGHLIQTDYSSSAKTSGSDNLKQMQFWMLGLCLNSWLYIREVDDTLSVSFGWPTTSASLNQCRSFHCNALRTLWKTGRKKVWNNNSPLPGSLFIVNLSLEISRINTWPYIYIYIYTRISLDTTKPTYIVFWARERKRYHQSALLG